MKWNLIKLGVAALAAVIIIGVVAALVSGLMTAFKPDTNATTSSTTGYTGGARGGGGMSSAVATPVAGASPVPVVYGSPGGVPGGMPSQGMPPEGVSGMQQVPASPGTGFASAPASSDMSGQQPGYASQQQPYAQYPYQAGAMPSQQPLPGVEVEGGNGISNNRISSNSNNISISSNQPFSATPSPVSFLGGRTGSWFNAVPAVGVSTPGTSAQQPVSALSPLPAHEQGQWQQSPVFIPPASSGAETPAVPGEQLSPYEAGWRQILSRLLEMLPLMFPGYFPGLQWYTVSSAY